MNTINWHPFFGRIIGTNIAPLNTYYNQAIDYQDTPFFTVEALLWLFHLNLAACQHVGSFAEKPSSRKLTLKGQTAPSKKKQHVIITRPAFAISVNSSSFCRRSLGQRIPGLGLEIEMMINSENAKHRWTPSNTKNLKITVGSEKVEKEIPKLFYMS